MLQLFTNNEDFFASLDEGMRIVTEPQADPDSGDLSEMKALYAVFVAAAVQLDPEAMASEGRKPLLQAVRMALLAAYNFGRERGPSEKTSGDFTIRE